MISIFKEKYITNSIVRETKTNIEIVVTNYYFILFWFLPIKIYSSKIQTMLA